MIHTVLIILNLIVLEGLLSVDNAAVLAIMVKHLPERDQGKALKWGMWGAFILRGVCLLSAALLLQFTWLKILGGLFLMRLCITHFTKKEDSIEEVKDTRSKGLYQWATTRIGLSSLWATIIIVEWMDLVFSMDNVFAAVALSQDAWVVITGVCIGIMCMRLVAVWFLGVMKKHPSLEISAFVVIGLLGIKLIISGSSHYVDMGMTEEIMANHWFDLCFSAGMMLIFFIPLIGRSKTS